MLTMVIAMSGAFVASRLQTPVYRSTIYLNVVPARHDWGLQQTIVSVMRNYAGIITSRSTAQEVISRLQLDITPDQLSEKITVKPIQSDLQIQIDADEYDPIIASSIAQTAAEVFVEYTDVQMQDQDAADRVEVSILDPARPGTLHKPKWKINVLAGAVLGALVGVIIVFVLRFLEAISSIMRSWKSGRGRSGPRPFRYDLLKAGSRRRRRRNGYMPNPISLVTLQSHHLSREAYRRSDEPQYATLDRSLRSLLVTAGQKGQIHDTLNLAVASLGWSNG